MQSHKNDTTYKMGIDIGSTTVKVVLADEENKIAFSRYRRHFSEIKKTVKDILKEAKEEIGNAIFSAMITGSGGVALAKALVWIHSGGGCDSKCRRSNCTPDGCCH